MKFKTMDEFYLWLERHEICKLDSGTQGVCYKVGSKVYKIFHQFIDEDEEDIIIYDKDEILQFSSIINSTYIFPYDTIMVGDIVVGYITDYVNAKSLYKINPLRISLDKFEKALEKVMKDIKIISNNGVISYDVTYNILYGGCGFKVIDTMEYSTTDMDSMKLYKINKERFDYEIRLFLIDGYFDEFISNNPLLYSMCYDSDVDFSLFLKEFRKKISENEGYEVGRLGEAKKSMVSTRSRKLKYFRG